MSFFELDDLRDQFLQYDELLLRRGATQLGHLAAAVLLDEIVQPVLAGPFTGRLSKNLATSRRTQTQTDKSSLELDNTNVEFALGGIKNDIWQCRLIKEILHSPADILSE